MVQRVSVCRKGIFSFERQLAGADLEDWLADGAAGRARHLYGYAVLGKIAVHRRYADSSADFVYGGGRRPAGAAGD